MMAGLTPKQKQFCEEYIIDLNATQAAIRAGYSEHTSNEQGSQLLAKLSIQVQIQRLMAERSERTQIKADDVLMEIAKLAYSNMLDYVDIDGGLPTVNMSEITREQGAAIQEVTVETRKEHNGRGGKPTSEIEKVKFKLADKGVNLERLGRHLKLFTDKVNLEGTGIVLKIEGKDAACL